MEKSPAEQEKELTRTWSRVRNLPDPKSNQRREFLVKLIELAHSPHGVVKKFAATHFKHLIKDFPDLQEDVINAIYDLCEDLEQMVRKAGYDAIQDVSEAEPKWVKRNVDVLVQLLQTDDRQEISFVKKALRSHMDIDTISTLGVFCDQICPQDDPMDEEEKQIRNRISTLVLNYLADSHSHLERHMEKPQNEKVLIDGLLRAVTKVEVTDVRIIVHDILLRLPVFKVSHSSRRKELNEALIRRLVASRKADSSLFATNDEAIVDLTLDLVTNYQVDPSTVTGFFREYLLGQDHISHLSPESLVIVARAGRRILVVCTKGVTAASGKQPIKGTFTSSDASTIITTSVEQGVNDVKTLADLGDMLAACKAAVVSKTWTLSKAALSSLRSLQMTIQNSFSNDSTGVASTVQDHIRSILEASSTPVKTGPSPPPPAGPSSARAAPVSCQSSDGLRQSGNKRKAEDIVPPQGPRNNREPAGSTQPTASTSIRPVERINHGLPPRPGPPTSPRRSQDARRTRDSRPSTPIAALSASLSRSDVKEDNPPPPKRSRVSASGTSTPQPPLSLKGAAASAPASKRASPERTTSTSLIDRIGSSDSRTPQPRQERAQESNDSRHDNHKSDKTTQFNIKGAASREIVEQNDHHRQRRGSQRRGPSSNGGSGGSLLDRMAPRRQ